MGKDSINILQNLNESELQYNDAVELKCKDCNSIIRFYNVSIQPYIDFYEAIFKNPEDEICPVCQCKEFYLEKFCYGKQSPNGDKNEIISKGK